MKFRTWTIVTALAVLTAVAVPAAIAVARCPMIGHGDHKAMFEHVAKELKLDETQKASVQKILEAHQPSLEVGHKAVVEALHNLADGIANPTTDDATIQELHAKTATLTQSMALEIHKMVQEINPILTEEQRTKAKAFFDQMKAMHASGKMGGRGHGRGGMCDFGKP